MVDNPSLTRSDLIASEPTPLDEFARSTAYFALQQPITGIAQLVDRASESNLAGQSKFMEPCREAKFGDLRWHAQAAGGAIGTLVPFMVSARMARGVVGRTAEQSAFAVESRLGLTLKESAWGGFLNDAVFRPVDPNKNFWNERLINGGIGAANFTALTATSVGLNRLSENRAFTYLKNPVVTGIVAGVPAGALGANIESLRQKGSLASTEETLKSVYHMAFAGGLLATKHQLLNGEPPKPATGIRHDAVVSPVVPDVISSGPRIRIREKTVTLSAESSVKPNEILGKKGPPPIPKQEARPLIAQEILELDPVRPPRPPRNESFEKAPKVEGIDPPLHGFFAKETHYKGIPIRSAQCVSDAALLEAQRRIETMLEHVPEIVERLYQEGAEFHIIGKNQEVSDLPELAHWKGRPFDGDQTIDQRTRGVGGRYSSCGEENLLKLKGDRYAGRDILCHEFAHTIHFFGLPPETVRQIKSQFEGAKNAGKWTGAYAAKNELEYFAELSMWYFGGRGDFGAIKPEPSPGREWLRRYDPAGYELIDSIYRTPESPTLLAPLLSYGGLRSAEGTPPSRLVVRNEGASPLPIRWIGHDGLLVPYGYVAAGQSLTLLTFVNHFWKIGDKVYLPETDSALVTVKK